MHVLANRSVSQVRSHGEVRDEADESGKGPEIVEDAFTIGWSGCDDVVSAVVVSVLGRVSTGGSLRLPSH